MAREKYPILTEPLSEINNKEEQTMSLYDERLQRTWDAIHMKKVDKIPFSYSGSAYMARAEGLTMAKYVSDFDAGFEAAANFCLHHPGIDTLHSPIFAPDALKMMWLSEIRAPGQELPEDELWQVHEAEKMTMDDYKVINEIGYGPWMMQYMERIGGSPMDTLAAMGAASAKGYPMMAEKAQMPIVNAANASGPVEAFCGARQLMNFYMDIMLEPELVKSAMDKAFEFNYQNFLQSLDAKPLGCWVGGWRAAPELMSHEIWMEYCWPYLKKLAETAVERGVMCFLHFDSCWDRELETLKELPARSCVLMTDSTTDLRLAREKLGDHMCLMGDVPSSMLAFSTPNEVYNYVTKLIDDIGHDTGLIVSSGCDCPLNAKPENADAMIQATIDYSVH